MIRLALAGPCLLAAGCAMTDGPSHRSRLLEVHDRDGVDPAVRLYEDIVLAMTDDFDVSLEKVIPVRLYIDREDPSKKSYYNPITGSIVLRSRPGPAVFAHELSHLLARQVTSGPDGWIDEALAEYMETRHAPGDPGGSEGDGETPRKRTERLVRLLADARDPSEVGAHLTPRAIREGRGWGVLVVQYFFDGPLRDYSMPEKIRRLFRIDGVEVEAMAPDVIAHFRRHDVAVGG